MDKHNDYELARRSMRRPQRKRMKQFRIDELSIVDRPAQAGAIATIYKSEDHPMDARARELLRQQMDALGHKLDAVTDRMRKAREDEEVAADRLRSLFRGKGRQADGQEDGFDDLDPDDEDGFEMADDTSETDYAMGAGFNDIEEIDEETDIDDLDMRDDEGEEVELSARNDELSDDIRHEQATDSDEDDDEDQPALTPVARLAQRMRRKDARLSKRQSMLMAAGRVAKAGGFYATRYSAEPQRSGTERELDRRLVEQLVREQRSIDPYISHTAAVRKALAVNEYAKATSRISTDSGGVRDAVGPFHAQRGAERRAQQDSKAAAFRRQLDREIQQMRASNPTMKRTDALRQLRDTKPELFDY